MCVASPGSGERVCAVELMFIQVEQCRGGWVKVTWSRDDAAVTPVTMQRHSHVAKHMTKAHVTKQVTKGHSEQRFLDARVF